MFITADDIKELTGRSRKLEQIMWLRENRWNYVVDAHGRPKVARSEFDRHLLGGAPPPTAPEPDFAALAAMDRAR